MVEVFAEGDFGVSNRYQAMDSRSVIRSPRQPTQREQQASLLAMKNTLIAAVSTFLSHYFNTRFLQSGWLTDFQPGPPRPYDPETASRRVLEMKTRFLYCLREGVRALNRYEQPFSALAAFQEDKITESLEIISTSERRFSDALVNRCTEVMMTDISAVKLTEAVCGQFLRRILQMVRQELRDGEHVKYLYLFCAWRMPEVLFDPAVSSMIRHREMRALVGNPRLPEDLLAALRNMRGGGIFGPPGRNGTKPVDEGWDLERRRIGNEPPPKRRAWRRLFSRAKRKAGRPRRKSSKTPSTSSPGT